MTHYPIEELNENDDDGTIPQSLEDLQSAVIGHRIVKVETVKHPDAYSYSYASEATTITLDNGTQVQMIGRGDCCAGTEVDAFLLHPELVDHIIMGVGTTGEYTTWHIYADMGDVLELTVGWSAGNTGYYAYGFDIRIVAIEN